ncbi:MAG: DotI/IcmL/TraM family protein [Alphaproteobacteria bacterium]
MQKIAFILSVLLITIHPVFSMPDGMENETRELLWSEEDEKNKQDEKTPEDLPNGICSGLPESVLIAWSVHAVTQAMTFRHDNQVEQFEEISKYFTKRGWKSFRGALDRSTIPDLVKKKKQSLSTTVDDRRENEIEIQSCGPVAGSEQAAVQIPLAMSFESENQMPSNTHMLVTIIVKGRHGENPAGIEQWIATSY